MRAKRDPSALGAGLYVVATPIGNLGDISLRAIEILKSADLIACEDTRVTRKLLTHFGIDTKTIAYHDHSPPAVRDRLIAHMTAGGAIALASDAGTPAIADPGYRLIGACIELGIDVTAAPGPNAALTGLVLSGLPTDRFLFAGYLPPRQGRRRRALTELLDVPATLIFQESARRLPASLGDMAEIFGERSAAVGRELTKKFEHVSRGALTRLAANFDRDGPPKGEVIVVVGPPGDKAPPDGAELDALLREHLIAGSVRDATQAVADKTGLPRRRIYERALKIAAPKDVFGDG